MSRDVPSTLESTWLRLKTVPSVPSLHWVCWKEPSIHRDFMLSSKTWCRVWSTIHWSQIWAAERYENGKNFIDHEHERTAEERVQEKCDIHVGIASQCARSKEIDSSSVSLRRDKTLSLGTLLQWSWKGKDSLVVRFMPEAVGVLDL